MIAMTEATDEAVKVCEEKLSDQDDRVKCAAVKALRKMGGSDRDKVVLVLDKALREERQQKIRQCIQSALRQLSQRGDRPPG
jgi:3-methyladenine DNA glycosylase AlkD